MLSGVEAQSAKYAAGVPASLPARKRPLPFRFEANGSVIYFTDGLDPSPRSRRVFNFPQRAMRMMCKAREGMLRPSLSTGACGMVRGRVNEIPWRG
jgi:type I site-specific restriction endonuclease